MNEPLIVRELDAHSRRLDEHGRALDSLSEWRAMVRGFLTALTIFASLPTIILAYMALVK
ncbi:MAG: hypothetical protein O3A25_19600 [Acidobacteria bacterium]|nr:hypothetical protein [Acidobacteriota bacterium]